MFLPTHTPFEPPTPELAPGLSPALAAHLSLHGVFERFVAELRALHESDDVELVHQARVDWRRFVSVFKLFRPALADDAVPSWEPLQTLLAFLGELRDLDVARTHTLPPLEVAYAAGDTARAQRWQAMALALDEAAGLKRKSVRYALREPAVQACLAAVDQWLARQPTLAAQPLAAPAAHGGKPKAVAGKGRPRTQHGPDLRHWLRKRVHHQHGKLQAALQAAEGGDAALTHRARILAKRLRYGVEAVQPLLAKRDARHLLRQSRDIQSRLGRQRDMLRAGELVAELGLESGLADFLRGVAVGRSDAA